MAMPNDCVAFVQHENPLTSHPIDVLQWGAASIEAVARSTRFGEVSPCAKNSLADDAAT
ncbi:MULTISPECIES: hypothetical protein [unclassified Lysobacter]|uniref:hypothetical protein n=1 Tax=unclassified Lysobacter TaxID=2635362 RepID=UPI001BE63EE1|nr:MULTISPECIES: hypothetical protein [unclassified Lysobacter]MBT2745529.1 hypothetical protein [Lysobacter sp. ISL-42]MBT2753468.1 hypothetical protein [Lysobacter sp. ISL-50]MBT2777148.1 hypothetical protein [Lysobacter sp. ISL-54]MBT2780226.1 hypothetical protein [Lysobacter sp. ISL-52]